MLLKVIEPKAEYRHHPSADHLFISASTLKGIPVIGVVLTGMGSDGAKGMVALRNNGSFNIVQDEETSVVYGMPKSAWQSGGAHVQSPLQNISLEIERGLNQLK